MTSPGKKCTTCAQSTRPASSTPVANTFSIGRTTQGLDGCVLLLHHEDCVSHGSQGHECSQLPVVGSPCENQGRQCPCHQTSPSFLANDADACNQGSGGLFPRQPMCRQTQTQSTETTSFLRMYRSGFDSDLMCKWMWIMRSFRCVNFIAH